MTPAKNFRRQIPLAPPIRKGPICFDRVFSLRIAEKPGFGTDRLMSAHFDDTLTAVRGLTDRSNE